MDKKQKAIEELKKQRKLARERLGPEGIRKLEKLAREKLGGGPNQPKDSPSVPLGSVPYDKKAAAAAFQLFLKNHGDPKEFERRLREMINKSSH